MYSVIIHDIITCIARCVLCANSHNHSFCCLETFTTQSLTVKESLYHVFCLTFTLMSAHPHLSEALMVLISNLNDYPANREAE